MGIGNPNSDFKRTILPVRRKRAAGSPLTEASDHAEGKKSLEKHVVTFMINFLTGLKKHVVTSFANFYVGKS